MLRAIGVSYDGNVSIHDPVKRRGRKSSSKRSVGNMAASVDSESKQMMAVAMLSGNGPDVHNELELEMEMQNG